MFHRCLELVSTPILRYQRHFFSSIIVLFFFLIMFEVYTKSSYKTAKHVKNQALKTVKYSVSEVKSTLEDIELSALGMMEELGDKVFPEIDINKEEVQVHTEEIDKIIRGAVGTHLNMGPLHDMNEPKVDIFENETEWDIPKHWLPSTDQRHEMQLKHATHPLNFDKDDVLVFMHIPKTSGKTFNSHIVKDMKVPKGLECQCKTLDKPHGCKCLNTDNEIWLFSRLTTAWPCGVHPSWSDLSRDCLNHAMDRKEGLHRKRRFTIATMLRSPYTRYISEWHQVNSDGQWRPFHRLRCYPLTREQYCYEDDWRGVTLDQFLECPSNPANNRQVRMLADLHIANCSEIFEWLTMPTEADTVDDINKRYQFMINNPVLRSAIHNLKSLSFFGLEEYQRETEYLFSRTFGYSFKRHFRQSKTFSEQAVITNEQRQKVLDLNRLDLVLYRYAKELFFKRLHENVKRKHVFFTDNIDFSTQQPPYTSTDITPESLSQSGTET